MMVTSGANRAMLYARVSSKDEEREGFSIPAPLKLLRQYAGEQHLTIVREFVDVETAEQSGRGGFGEMIRSNTACLDEAASEASVWRSLAGCVGRLSELVWFVEPSARRVTVHRPNEQPRTFIATETLRGGHLLPGFQYPLSRFFRD
jgi:hypothetical protein